MQKAAKKRRPALALNIALGFLAGYVDAVGFMGLSGLFTAHITGNLILLSAELATPGHTFPLLKILAFPAFIAGAALAKLIAALCQKKARNALLALYAAELMLLAAFMLAGRTAGSAEASLWDLTLLAGIAGTMAMGVQSASGRLLLPELAPTVMMTGNITQFVIEFIELIRHPCNRTARSRCAKFFWPITAFGGGALMAAFAFVPFGFQALWLPIALVLALAGAEAWSMARQR